MKIGEFLVKEGLVSDAQIKDALEMQKKSGGRLGEILQANAGIRALDYYRALGRYFNLEFMDLTCNEIDTSLLEESDRAMYVEDLFLPIGVNNGETVVAVADPSEGTLARIRARWGGSARIVATAKFDIFYILKKAFAANYSHEIVAELHEKDSTKSAVNTFTPRQVAFVALLLLVFAGILYISYPLGMIIFNTVLTISVTVVLLYKFVLAFIGMTIPVAHEREKIEVDDLTLPTYTILVPMFKEKRVTVEHLAKNLRLLDYPSHKLDIKLVLEGDDDETIRIVKELRLPAYFEIVCVPPSEPRTKPKACNYALKFARGEYITIYDAEDRPDPDQLKIALHTFRQGDERLACVQCALNYYNSRENWLTRMFTMEYTFWFDLMLPALSRLGLPIPLGGTSNHFKTEFLKDMVAWDPFNVTEDADLGIRMNRLKYRSQAVVSTTYEEANCRTMNWIRQRTRWLKGYMQTYLIHMRHPVTLLKDLGPAGFLSFQLFVGGTVSSNLANIVLIVIFVISLICGPEKINVLFPSPTLEIAWFNFFFGNIFLLLLNLLGVWRRGLRRLALFTLTVPLYWLMASVACYRALFQLFFYPSHWEKTEHGISNVFYDKW